MCAAFEENKGPKKDRGRIEETRESLISGSSSFEAVNALDGFVIVQRLQSNGIT